MKKDSENKKEVSSIKKQEFKKKSIKAMPIVLFYFTLAGFIFCLGLYIASAIAYSKHGENTISFLKPSYAYLTATATFLVGTCASAIQIISYRKTELNMSRDVIKNSILLSKEYRDSLKEFVVFLDEVRLVNDAFERTKRKANINNLSREEMLSFQNNYLNALDYISTDDKIEDIKKTKDINEDCDVNTHKREIDKKFRSAFELINRIFRIYLSGVVDKDIFSSETGIKEYANQFYLYYVMICKIDDEVKYPAIEEFLKNNNLDVL